MKLKLAPGLAIKKSPISSKGCFATKTFEQRRPRTVYRLTALGKGALNRYLDHVEAVIKATRRT